MPTCTVYNIGTQHNWIGGWDYPRNNTIDAIRIEYEMKYWKAPFSRSVLITFVAHGSFACINQSNTDAKKVNETFSCEHTETCAFYHSNINPMALASREKQKNYYSVYSFVYSCKCHMLYWVWVRVGKAR